MNQTIQSTVQAIKQHAAEIHADVNQHYDDKPYSYHLNMVADFAAKFIGFFDEHFHLSIMFGAYFHDSIEDARLTYNDVMKIAKQYMNEYDAHIATEIVYALTNDKGRNRAERAGEKYYKGIRETPFAAYVKLCDRMANFSYSITSGSGMAQKYKAEMDHFINSIVAEGQTDTIFMVPNEMRNYINNLMKQL